MALQMAHVADVLRRNAQQSEQKAIQSARVAEEQKQKADREAREAQRQSQLAEQQRRWPVLLAPFAVAAVVTAPLGLYFARNSDQFWGRAENLSGWGMGTAERIWDAVGIFTWRGDDIPRHNLPFRPLFDPLAGGLFLPAYNLELAGGRFHSDLWFALGWGAFPAFTGYFARDDWIILA